MLVYGNTKVNYADKVVAVEKQVLSFSNPQIPYKWENVEAIQGGYFCIFNQYFFHQYGNLTQYSVFQQSGEHIFELTDEQATQVEVIYKQMFKEINSDYLHKYDVLHNLVFELLHFAMKVQPVNKVEIPTFSNAAQRIVALSVELLERQFPIIAERILQESKILLRHSNWNVAEIAYSLGFAEVTHFNNFFKKHTTQTPKKFRNV
jgi:AraC-like DNA-binding protein